MIVESADGSHYARLEPADDGVIVTVWRRLPHTDAPMGRRVGPPWHLDCPLHVALDRVERVVRSLRGVAPLKNGVE